ncbi:MAG: thiamine phosphate synthase [Nitrospirota bacterium]|nr:thiamine phosphate synthase [Nitrospirota bacterium]
MKIDFNLYLITDRKLLSDRCSLTAAVEQALKGGVKAVQLREKDLGAGELLVLAHKIRKLTLKYDAKLFINDRFDIALAVNADGVHLTQNSMPVNAVRRTVKDRLMIGVSTHSLKEAKEAQRGGADLVTLGPVYRTPSKLRYGAPLGIDNFRRINKKISVPVFALGGVKIKSIEEVQRAGAYGIAVISEIFRADNIRKRTEEIIQILSTDRENK